jgi:DNA topoisomerase I
MSATESLPATRHIIRPPGLHRLSSRPDSWADLEGNPVVDAAVTDRLRRLSIPPGWTHVWASLDPASPVQATGVDYRGRTQYRYSDAAEAAASQDKFDHLLQFAAYLPQLREQVDADLGAVVPASEEELEPRRVTAAVIRLLDRGLFRVGNERYARDNHTYGLTTLRRNQVSVADDTATFDFVGKEHIEHHLVVTDAGAAAVVAALLAQEADPEFPVFATSDPPLWRRIDSVTVNSYIHAHGAVMASAKTFRTWGATVAAASVAAGASFHDGPKTRRNFDLVPYDAAAHMLGDTPAVARRSYVHPLAVEAGRSAAVAAAVRAATSESDSDDVRDVFHDSGVQAAVFDFLVSTA